MGSSDQIIACTPKYLPNDEIAKADEIARQINPDNRSAAGAPAGAGDRIALRRTAYWGKQGVRLTVGFLDGPEAALRTKILAHMNAWNRTANVTFTESATDPDVRIARLDSPRELRGYWSYVGTDIKLPRRNEPTMNLQGFTMKTPDSEFVRVVRHETGHTLGFEHEHMRAELIKRLDRKKTIEYFMQNQGWTEADVIRQVLTPLEESSLLGSPRADGNSIMCYQIPGDVTVDGVAIPGGTDIDAIDYEMVAKFYPKAG